MDDAGLSRWILRLEALIATLHERGMIYTSHGCRVLREEPPRDGIPEWVVCSEIREFFRHVNSVSLPDVHNGYWIQSLDWIGWGSHPRFAVIEGRPVPILVFGADGGGSLFAAAGPTQRSIQYLPNASIQAGTYCGVPEHLADTFGEFLLRLAEDVEAYAFEKTGHSFMAR